MKYILLALAMALIVAVTSCENGKVELPVGNTGTDTVDIEETVGIDTTVKDTTDIEDTTSGDTTVEVTTVTESIESSDISETTEETTANTDDIIAVYDSISLLFEPCELPHEEFDESDIDTTSYIYSDVYFYTNDYEATILGHKTSVHKIVHSSKNRRTAYFITCTDKETGEVFFQGYYAIFCDVDGDGNLEAIKDDKLYMNKYGEILVADVKAPFERYIQRKHPLAPDYSYSIFFENDKDYANFSYRIKYDGDNYFESHELQALYKDNSYYFVYDNPATINPNEQYVSNDPNWRVEIAYTDVNEYFVNKNGLYTINICGPNGEVFPFYDYEGTKPLDKSYWDRGLAIGGHLDEAFDRQLIVHPNYSYAVLVYPYCTQTCDQISGSDALLIDLKTGDFAINYPSEIIDSYETADGSTNIPDFEGSNTCTEHIGVDITEESFIITSYIRKANGDILESTTRKVDLKNLDLSSKN